MKLRMRLNILGCRIMFSIALRGIAPHLSFTIVLLLTLGLSVLANPVQAADTWSRGSADVPVAAIALAPDEIANEVPTPNDAMPNRATATSPDGKVIVITLVGDTGFSPSHARVRSDGVTDRGRRFTWAETTSSIAHEINGDINFANIETVITDKNTLYPVPKSFNFRTHPNGLRHLSKIGFNLLSLANNHSFDYSVAGVRETLKHVATMHAFGIKAHAGLGLRRSQASAPKLFNVKGVQFAFSAMGIGGAARAAATSSRPGQINIHDPKAYAEVVDRLSAAPADFRILSMHYGTERVIEPSWSQVRKWRHETLKAKGIDIIVGHHAHVVEGIEMTDGRLIFYGLGNFLHHGMQNMAKFNRCRDYGLLARVYLVKSSDGATKIQAVEVVPLTDMHVKTRPMAVDQAHRRIEVLNALARRLDDPSAGARGVRFAPRPNGTGLYCVPGAERSLEPIASLCKSVSEQEVAALTDNEPRRLRCGGYLALRPATARNASSRTARAKSHPARKFKRRSRKKTRVAARRKKSKAKRRHFRDKPGAGR
ncbi:MAG: CapA family protein, partial [Hyphomicrobiaceae bacterium]